MIPGCFRVFSFTTSARAFYAGITADGFLILDHCRIGTIFVRVGVPKVKLPQFKCNYCKIDCILTHPIEQAFVLFSPVCVFCPM